MATPQTAPILQVGNPTRGPQVVTSAAAFTAVVGGPQAAVQVAMPQFLGNGVASTTSPLLPTAPAPNLPADIPVHTTQEPNLENRRRHTSMFKDEGAPPDPDAAVKAGSEDSGGELTRTAGGPQGAAAALRKPSTSHEQRREAVVAMVAYQISKGPWKVKELQDVLRCTNREEIATAIEPVANPNSHRKNLQDWTQHFCGVRITFSAATDQYSFKPDALKRIHAEIWAEAETEARALRSQTPAEEPVAPEKEPKQNDKKRKRGSIGADSQKRPKTDEVGDVFITQASTSEPDRQATDFTDDVTSYPLRVQLTFVATSWAAGQKTIPNPFVHPFNVPASTSPLVQPDSLSPGLFQQEPDLNLAEPLGPPAPPNDIGGTLDEQSEGEKDDDRMDTSGDSPDDWKVFIEPDFR